MKAGFLNGYDGVPLAYRELGAGRMVILLHGLFSNATVNWFRFGHAEPIAAAGFRVVAPDLRGHGDSAAPHDAAAYPPDVLVHDLTAIIAQLDCEDYDLCGFSLGARTVARGVVAGLRPRRAVLAGMGLEGLTGWSRRRAFFAAAMASYDTAKRGDPYWLAVQFMKTMQVDRVAATHLLDSFTDMEPAALAAMTMPVLVVCGDQDADNGDPVALAAALPDATLVRVPGTHMSSVTHPELGEAIATFLRG